MIRRILNWFVKPRTGYQPHQPDNESAQLAAAAATPGGNRMQCQKCPQPATLHITELPSLDHLEELHLCEPCAFRYLSGPNEQRTWHLPPAEKRSEAIQSATATTGIVTGSASLPASLPSREVRLEVRRIIISEIHEQQVIMLQEVDGDRAFSIMIGIFEATGIDRTVKQLPSPRPLTHDAWLSTILSLGVIVQAACIHDLRQHTYYAKLRLLQDGEVVEVDVRPSDAVNMALKAGCPLVMPESLLAQVCA
jgi:bifunctional DNase/RNase